jgi:hypothetical protein
MHRSLIPSLILALSFAASASAQTSRYEPVDRTDRLQEMVGQLKTLVDEADRARAADRRFIRDLRDLVRSYDWPWQSRVFHDDFRDGNYAHGPAWQLVEGGFRVEPRLGLRTLDRPVETAREAPARRSDDSGKDLAIALLGALLEQKPRAGGEPKVKPAPSPARGAIQLNADIPNSFALELDLRVVGQAGEIEFQVLQTGAANQGYRITYVPSGSPSFELRRSTNRGTSVIAAHYDPVDANDGTFHKLVWTRRPSGEMQLKLDGREILKTVDRTLKRPFHAFQIRHLGGDFAIREVTLWGAKP